MGRPPIGKVAMTNAERVRRHRAQFRNTNPVTKPKPVTDTAEVAALRHVLAAAKARIAELERGVRPKKSAKNPKQSANSPKQPAKRPEPNDPVSTINEFHREAVGFLVDFTQRVTAWYETKPSISKDGNRAYAGPLSLRRWICATRSET
jgi:hypothetical protein